MTRSEILQQIMRYPRPVSRYRKWRWEIESLIEMGLVGIRCVSGGRNLYARAYDRWDNRRGYTTKPSLFVVN